MAMKMMLTMMKMCRLLACLRSPQQENHLCVVTPNPTDHGNSGKDDDHKKYDHEYYVEDDVDDDEDVSLAVPQPPQQGPTNGIKASAASQYHCSDILLYNCKNIVSKSSH